MRHDLVSNLMFTIFNDDKSIWMVTKAGINQLIIQADGRGFRSSSGSVLASGNERHTEFISPESILIMS